MVQEEGGTEWPNQGWIEPLVELRPAAMDCWGWVDGESTEWVVE